MLFVDQQLKYYEASVAVHPEFTEGLRSGVVSHAITSQSTSYSFLPFLLSVSQTAPSMARLLFNSTFNEKKMADGTSENCGGNRMPLETPFDRSPSPPQDKLATKVALCSCCWSPKAYPQFNHYNYTLIHVE